MSSSHLHRLHPLSQIISIKAQQWTTNVDSILWIDIWEHFPLKYSAFLSLQILTIISMIMTSVTGFRYALI